jgi:hypothetical protein
MRSSSMLLRWYAMCVQVASPTLPSDLNEWCTSGLLPPLSPQKKAHSIPIRSPEKNSFCAHTRTGSDFPHLFPWPQMRCLDFLVLARARAQLALSGVHHERQAVCLVPDQPGGTGECHMGHSVYTRRRWQLLDFHPRAHLNEHGDPLAQVRPHASSESNPFNGLQMPMGASAGMAQIGVSLEPLESIAHVCSC